ncbi:MAG: hypothetical protein ACPLN0_01800 [Candidatus Hydrothermia bacterium]
MPDILQILNDYIVEKVKKSQTDVFTVRIPSDLILKVAKFYLTPYLAEPEIKLEGDTLIIHGFNVVKVDIKVKLEEILWTENNKIIKFSLKTSELIKKFLDRPLQALEQQTHGVIKVSEDKIELDIEKLLNLYPKWNSATYSSRNLVKLDSILFGKDVIELIFRKAKL